MIQGWFSKERSRNFGERCQGEIFCAKINSRETNIQAFKQTFQIYNSDINAYGEFLMQSFLERISQKGFCRI